MKTTRKQEILKEIEAAETDGERRALIEELKRRPFNRLDSMPFRRWNQQNIAEAIAAFITRHKYIPTIKDFKADITLPTHVSVKKAFGISLKEYLDKSYPEYRQCSLRYNYSKSPEEWLQFFIHNYNLLKPSKSESYNSLRPKGSPTWRSIAKLCGAKTWSELKHVAEVVDYDKLGNVINRDIKLIAVSHNDLTIELGVGKL